mmetsp:Transcript_34271/g.91536  ORF Transcript_34271/g.91536 Transcript_34271/m.91536 type:complete len:127 (-) Transcript_34271:261-641(-)
MKTLKTATPKKAMKVGKAMKAMKESRIARGRLMRAAVLSGRKEKTYTGLRASDLKRNKVGKIVTKRKSALAKKRYEGSKLQQWVKAVTVARKQLSLSGYVGLNSPTPEGRALYAKARANYNAIQNA